MITKFKIFEKFINRTINDINSDSDSFFQKGDTVSKLEIKGENVGELHYRVSNNYLEIIFIEIYNKYRGKGYGNLLMGEIIKKAKKLECKFIELEVLSTNEKAINLYKKYDFYIKNRDSNYLIMKKEII